MIDWWSGVAVDEDACGRRGDEDADPLTPPAPKTKVAENLEKEGPGNGVEGLGDVKLKHDSRALRLCSKRAVCCTKRKLSCTLRPTMNAL